MHRTCSTKECPKSARSAPALLLAESTKSIEKAGVILRPACLLNGQSKPTFSRIIESTPEPNAYERLLSFDQDRGCILGDAIDVAQMISDGLRRYPRVEVIVGKVEAISKDRNLWDFVGHAIKAE